MMQQPELQIVRIKTPIGNNSIQRCFHVMYMTQFEWQGKQYDFRLVWVERADADSFRGACGTRHVYCRSCGGFIVRKKGSRRLGKQVYSAYTECLSEDMLRQCVEEFMKKGPMGEHCIGSPIATKAVSNGLRYLSEYIGKENGIFDQNSLEKRRVMLTEELASLKRNDCSLGLTEREMEVLNLAVDKNDFGIIQKYLMTKGKRIYDDNLPI